VTARRLPPEPGAPPPPGGPRGLEAALRRHALSYPEAYEEHPWGERAIKVRGKVFVFMSAGRPEVTLSVKLPGSRNLALMFPFTEPTGYGLGRSGWVTSRFEAGEKAPTEILESWIDESYRAVAPKKLVALLDGPPRPMARRRRASRRRRA
jgi:predicted DNA-binding protein (MmcQ/YjbR family)